MSSLQNPVEGDAAHDGGNVPTATSGTERAVSRADVKVSKLVNNLLS